MPPDHFFPFILGRDPNIQGKSGLAMQDYYRSAIKHLVMPILYTYLHSLAVNTFSSIGLHYVYNTTYALKIQIATNYISLMWWYGYARLLICTQL